MGQLRKCRHNWTIDSSNPEGEIKANLAKLIKHIGYSRHKFMELPNQTKRCPVKIKVLNLLYDASRSSKRDDYHWIGTICTCPEHKDLRQKEIPDGMTMKSYKRESERNKYQENLDPHMDRTRKGKMVETIKKSKRVEIFPKIISPTNITLSFSSLMLLPKDHF